MRPGQFGIGGVCSRSICPSGNLTSAETGTLTESLTEAPWTAQSSKSRSAVMMTRSVSASISSSLAPGRKSPGGTMLPPRPQKTLGADQTLGAQLDLRLVPELVPAAQQNVAQRQLAAARLGRGSL